MRGTKQVRSRSRAYIYVPANGHTLPEHTRFRVRARLLSYALPELMPLAKWAMRSGAFPLPDSLAAGGWEAFFVPVVVVLLHIEMRTRVVMYNRDTKTASMSARVSTSGNHKLAAM